ncbi:MAG: alpha-hydroxy-acid oxidizing protein [Nevskiaceae bacterium]|nr:alpha-hydroxy-acid oxidizing protein [Nevskiaceae bacterium]
MTVINSIADLREIAKRRVPKSIFEYLDHGSYDEHTLRANRSDLDAIKFRQRVLIDVARQQLTRPILGMPANMPLAIGPTGMCGFVHGDGEIHTARAARDFGIPFCLSTVSICSIEDVKQATNTPFWFQLYVMKDRGYTSALIDRAEAAGCPVLMMTVDIPVSGLRRRDAKNGLSVPPKLTLRNAIDIGTKPRWVWSVLRGKRRHFGNLADAVPDTAATSFAQWVASQFDASVTWKDLAKIRARWPGKLIVKGILDPQDAREAVALGADGIIVSNHGGRQLDGAVSTIRALPRVVDAVAGRCEVLFDGGVRSGQDILKAIALGANAALTGRAYLYGLGAMGEAGVALALQIIAREMQVTLALTGCNDVRDVDRSLLDDEAAV